MEHVVVLTLPDLTKARKALVAVERLEEEERLRVAGAALVERRADGALAVHRLDEDARLLATGAGSAIGAVLGALAGPPGIVAGAATGAVVGALVDAAEAEDSASTLRSMGKAVPPGKAAVVAVVAETSPAAIDRLADDLGAGVLRRERSEVELEIAASEEAAIAARRDADAHQTIGDRLRDVKNALTGRE